MNERRYCTVEAGGQLFGLPLAEIEEIIPARPATPVPLAPAPVEGLIHLRGQLITAIHLPKQLGMPVVAGDTAPMQVITRTSQGRTAFRVDAVGDILALNPQAIAAPPATLPSRLRALAQGVYFLAGRVLILLDVEAISQTEYAVQHST